MPRCPIPKILRELFLPCFRGLSADENLVIIPIITKTALKQSKTSKNRQKVVKEARLISFYTIKCHKLTKIAKFQHFFPQKLSYFCPVFQILENIAYLCPPPRGGGTQPEYSPLIILAHTKS